LAACGSVGVASIAVNKNEGRGHFRQQRHVVMAISVVALVAGFKPPQPKTWKAHRLRASGT
jgi:hypothetical protein